MRARDHGSLKVQGVQLEPSLDFMRILWNIEHGLESTSKRMGATLGITGPQRLVLRIVAKNPNVSPKELARILHLHPSTITGILQRLVDKRLLVSARDSRDRRRVLLRVLPAARRFTAGNSGTIEAAVAGVLARTRPAHIRRTRELLWAIATALRQPASRLAIKNP